MSFAIGLRFYRISLHKEGDSTPIEYDDFPNSTDLFKLIKEFTSEKANPTDEGDKQRSWYLDLKKTKFKKTIHGLISYGTHGFESKLVDNKTKAEKYRRQTTDLEEIPLYFGFFVPDKSKYALAAFQSFQGKSCITFVMDSLQNKITNALKGYSMQYTKIMPSNRGSLLDAPVKSLTMSRLTKVSDEFDKYLNGTSKKEVKYELSIKAKSKSSLGIYRNYKPTEENEVFLYNGIEFNQVKAEVVIGTKRRMVGILGASNNAGVIDVSDNVNHGKDGHPVFQSIANEVEDLFSEIFKMV